MFGTLTVYLIAIVVLLYAYVYVWSKGPRDGKLSKRIRGLEHEIGRLRKRARKQHVVLVALLALFLLPIVNPSPYVAPPAIGIEPNETAFLTAADGDVSSESIGEDYSQKFRETLDNNVLFYPDTSFLNDTKVVASSGVAVDDQGDSYTDTHVDDTSYFRAGKVPTGYITLNFTIPAGITVEGFYWSCLYFTVSNDDSGSLYLYNWDTDVWDSKDTLVTDGSEHTITGSVYGKVYWEDSKVAIKLDSTDAVGPGEIKVDYVYLQFYYMTLADSDHYAESFADVSDWATSDTSISSDGDLATITENGAGSTGRAYASFSSTDYFEYYYEFRIESMTATTANLEFWDGAAYNTLKTFTAAGTYKGIISDTDATTMQRIGFLVGSDGGNIKPDYLRVGKSTEMGWQHDCSTTEGFGYQATRPVIVFSTDGDLMTCNPSGDDARIEIQIDTTATQTKINEDYYQFIEFSINSVTDGDSDGAVWRLRIFETDALYSDFDKDTWHDDAGIFRINFDAWDNGAGTDIDEIKYFKFYLDDADDVLVLDYIKLYSIANFTVTQSGVGTDDYLYVDSGVLCSHVDDGYIELDHDPALSVSDTYSVYNLTTSGTAPQFSDYVSSWSSYSSETRGATTSGTVTDIKLKFDSTETLSAIKFIEDGTAPSVLRISATPPEPDDTESVTLSALATDTVEVYKVWFRPITGPTGYSQTDYESTEQADNLWTYEFASLDEGYWAFKAIAFDGANNSTLDADSVTDFWVREKELIISNTLYTETSTQCSFAGQTNVACDYLIYDDDVEQESGNKAAGSFFLDWTKQTSVGTHDWGIKFYTASSTDWHNGSYEVLTTTLLVTEYGIRTTDNYAYLNGYVTLDSNYTVYEETVQVGTGSVSAGSFEIRWTKASSSVENVTVLFESGSQSYPVYSGYDVAEQTTFVVEQWWVSLQIGLESYVEFYAHTSWENATIYVYDNTTLMVTVSELEGGASSNFWMSEVQGLHTITLNITHGGTVHTRTKTYYIPDWAVSGLSLRWSLYTFQDNYTMLSLESNWRNCSYSVYLNGSLVATSANDPVTLNFTRSINVGEYNLTIFADGGAQTYSVKNIRYIITEEGVSYDYSQVTGGRSVRYGDNYNYYTVTTEEPAPGILIDQGTATIVSVGGFLIFFLAFLAAREIKKSEILKTERVLSR